MGDPKHPRCLGRASDEQLVNAVVGVKNYVEQAGGEFDLTLVVASRPCEA
jgi:hypothetical protein